MSFEVVILPSTCCNCGRIGLNQICRKCFAAYCAQTIECAQCDCEYEDDE